MIKLRTAIVPTFSLPTPSTKLREQKSFNEADEEITILFEGGKVVSIDGKSLWMVLRICVGSNQYESSNTLSNSTGESSTGGTTFAYKKWHFEEQENVVDVVSFGELRFYTLNFCPLNLKVIVNQATRHLFRTISALDSKYIGSNIFNNDNSIVYVECYGEIYCSWIKSNVIILCYNRFK